MGKSSRLAIVLAGARVFFLGMLALLILPCDSSVGAVTFATTGATPPRANGPVAAPSVPSLETNPKPPTGTKKGWKKRSPGVYVGVAGSLTVFVGMIIYLIVSLRWCLSHPLRIFISHAGGLDGSKKNFPTWLQETMRTHRWSVAKCSVRIFFDTEDIEMGKSIAEKILKELARFDVGVVVVTNAFFVAKWPMTELIAFVEAQMNDPTDRIRVLPLFYELSPEQVRTHLVEKTWEGHWEEMSKGDHPLQVEKCTQAVRWLCQQRGIPYGYEKRDQDRAYIQTICKEVNDILCKERSFASYLIGVVTAYCIPSHCKPGNQ